MEIKLIALDLDGTLLDDDHTTVPLRNVQALRAAAERGVAIAISSGRTWKLLEEVIAQMGEVHYAVLSNGAAVMDAKTGAFLYQSGMQQAQCQAITNLLLAENVPFEIYCEGQNYLAQSQLGILRDCAINPKFMEMFERNSLLVNNLNAAVAGKCVEKFHLFEVPANQRAGIEAKLRATGPMAVTQSFRNNMELTGEGVNKGTALAELCQRLSISAESVMAFGDAGNDLEMLRWAGWSFAMANASEEAMAAAKYKTLTNHEGGVGAAVEQYIL